MLRCPSISQSEKTSQWKVALRDWISRWFSQCAARLKALNLRKPYASLAPAPHPVLAVIVDGHLTPEQTLQAQQVFHNVVAAAAPQANHPATRRTFAAMACHDLKPDSFDAREPKPHTNLILYGAEFLCRLTRAAHNALIDATLTELRQLGLKVVCFKRSQIRDASRIFAYSTNRYTGQYAGAIARHGKSYAFSSSR